jgi:hypothetical protein
MGLVTADHSKGGIVNVRACPIEGDRNTALLAVEGRPDVQKCLSAISSGKEMFFMLGNQARYFVKLPLPNNGEFKTLYNETYERVARAQDASRDGLYLKRFLRGFDALLAAATTGQRSFARAFKDGRRRLAKTALDTFTGLKIATYGLTRGYSIPDKISAMAERLIPRPWTREWVVFGASVLAGMVVIVALFGSSNVQSTSSSRSLSNSRTSPAGPVQTTANVKMQAETVDYLTGLPDYANKELPKQEQTSAPTEVHLVNARPAKVHPAVKARPAKAHAAIQQRDDDQLKFLFDR